jgi:hypothetical protein
MASKQVDLYDTATLATGDTLLGIDVSDTTDSASGTIKRFAQPSAGNATSTGADASKGTGTAGDLYLPNDGLSLYRSTGSAQTPWGPIFPLATPPSSGWSWVNQETSTVDTSHGGITITAAASASADNFRGYVRTAPSTPYTITALMLINFTYVPASWAALGWRQSGDGKVVTLQLQPVTNPVQLRVASWNSPTSYNSLALDEALPVGPGYLWLRIADNGTDRIESISRDGYHFTVVHSVGRTSFLTGDQVGFFVNSGSATRDFPVTLLSWAEA